VKKLALAFALGFSLACNRGGPSGADAGVTSAPKPAEPRLASSSVGAAAPTADASVAANAADPCADATPPRSGKSIGHTSVVFKLELADGKKVAWKPESKRGRGRYKGEIAAYRLATALGIDNVLPACPRTFDVATMNAIVAPGSDGAKLLASEVVADGDAIHGASIVWFDALSFWPLEKDPLRSEARAWLTAGSTIPPGKTDLARQVSTLFAFDFLTTNWDRFSGENVGFDKAADRLLYVDNDAAFMDTPPKGPLARIENAVNASDRFSRAFVAHLRECSEERLTQIFGDELPGKPLLERPTVALVARRVDKLIAKIDRKIRARGEAETLYFP
jgi:hypothetical protein